MRVDQYLQYVRILRKASAPLLCCPSRCCWTGFSAGNGGGMGIMLHEKTLPFLIEAFIEASNRTCGTGPALAQGTGPTIYLNNTEYFAICQGFRDPCALLTDILWHIRELELCCYQIISTIKSVWKCFAMFVYLE
jgi:hypothetical protein